MFNIANTILILNICCSYRCNRCSWIQIINRALRWCLESNYIPLNVIKWSWRVRERGNVERVKKKYNKFIICRYAMVVVKMREKKDVVVADLVWIIEMNKHETIQPISWTSTKSGCKRRVKKNYIQAQFEIESSFFLLYGRCRQTLHNLHIYSHQCTILRIDTHTHTQTYW